MLEIKTGIFLLRAAPSDRTQCHRLVCTAPLKRTGTESGLNSPFKTESQPTGGMWNYMGSVNIFKKPG